MRAYISVDHSSRKKLSKEFIALGMALGGANVEQFIYVDKNQPEEGQEQDWIQNALAEIDQSNFVIAETTYLNVNTCVEIGYARAKKKPVVYLQKENEKVHPMLSGLCNFHIFYNSPKDLFDQTSEFLKNVLPQK